MSKSCQNEDFWQKISKISNKMDSDTPILTRYDIRDFVDLFSLYDFVKVGQVLELAQRWALDKFGQVLNVG